MIADPPPILRARALGFAYPGSPPLIDGLDLDVHPAELLAVAGPNGAGKSTLLRLLVGLLSPRRGSITLHGASLADMRLNQRARRIALLPQSPSAPPDLTVAELVRLGRHPYLGMRVFESSADLAVVRDALAATAMTDFADRRMGTLSGGEAQRAHLAACLAQEPQVLALDEPTSDLDLAHQLHVLRLLRALARDQRLAVVLVTHDLNLAARFADAVCVLDRGSIALAGPPDRVLRDPKLAIVYGVEFIVLENPSAGPPVLIARTPGGDEGDRS